MIFGGAQDKLRIFVDTLPTTGNCYRPGDTVGGRVVLESQSTITLKCVTVCLVGRSAVSAERKNGEPDTQFSKNGGTSDYERADEEVIFLEIAQQVFPPEKLAPNLENKSLSLQKGQHEFKFAFVFPERANARTQSTWQGLVLPGTCILPRRKGSIEYTIRAEVKRSGLLTWNLKEQVPIMFLPLGPSPPDTRMGYTQRRFRLAIHDRVREDWYTLAKRAIGMSTATSEIPLCGRLASPLVGLPTPLDGLSEIGQRIKCALLQVQESTQGKSKEKGSPPAELAYPIQVTSCSLSINSTYSLHARNVTETLVETTPLVEKHTLEHTVVFHNGESSLDSLFKDLRMPATVTMTMLTPNMRVSHDLFMEITTTTTVGSPIVPTNVTVGRPLTIFSPKTAGGQGDGGYSDPPPGDTPPPYVDHSTVPPPEKSG